MSMLCRPMWPFLLMYGSHDMRHTGFPQVDSGQRDPRDLGCHTTTTKHTLKLKALIPLVGPTHQIMQQIE